MVPERVQPLLAETAPLAERFTAAGWRIYLVGGSVRDAILGRPLDAGAPVGTYRVRLHQPGKSDFAGQFEVQSYRLESIDLKFDVKKTVVFRGETVEADVVARYQYGAPAANRPVAVRLPDGRILRGHTDAGGKYHVTFPTEGFAEEQTLRLAAQLTQDGVNAAASVALAVRAFAFRAVDGSLDAAAGLRVLAARLRGAVGEEGLVAVSGAICGTPDIED